MAVLASSSNFGHISIKLKKQNKKFQADRIILAGRGDYLPMYKRLRRLEIKIKINKKIKAKQGENAGI